MLTKDFSYSLPDSLIAQYPTSERGTSRMLVLAKDHKIFDKKSMELIEYVREPLRLGTDVFISGSLSIEKINALLKLLNEYKKTFEIKNINECHFIATSAIRDASNNKLIVDALRKENINLQIISGEVEAELLSNFQCLNKKYCVVDIKIDPRFHEFVYFGMASVVAYPTAFGIFFSSS